MALSSSSPSSSSSSSSSSSITRQRKYDVFISFRGEDTRDNFTSHLHTALCQKKILTFIDYELKKGDEISPALLKAIEEAKISIIIFSKDYASSKWCLDELAYIIQCKKMNGQMVIPVFYHVNPSDIRKQMGSFKDAFAKHEKVFKKVTEKVQRWRTALTEASNLSGWDSMVTRPESKLVEEIVKDILKKLKDTSISSNHEGLVGLNSRIEQIKSLLCIGLPNLRIVGIWGMGGIGKTTIAGAIFNQIFSQFEGCCFIANVREESEKCDGLARLQEQVLSKILEEENLDIGTPNIPLFIKERIQRKKVFIVLDDVNSLDQLEFFAKGFYGFGPGSRIIITTRDKQVLCNYGVHNIYKVERLNNHEALELFCNYSFKQKHVPKDMDDLSNKFVHYANGNPLALKVLGSSLFRKSKQDWESALHKLNRIPNPKILKVLRISYDGLDREEKNIFLDIACFFKLWKKDYVIKILESCYFSFHFGLSVLIDKSLITISNNELEIHDLLQEMAWEIVSEDSFKEPGKRTRLWNHEDVYHILKENTGTDAVEGIFLDMSKIKDLNLSSGAFANMPNLRLLRFHGFQKASKLHFPRGLKYLSDKLRYLHWQEYPLKSLPPEFSPQNLVELNLPSSSVEQLWKGTKHASQLKSIDLSYSRNLIGIPDLSDATKLEVINLKHCESLLTISSSIQHLQHLGLLSLEGCKKLRSFPSNIHFSSPIRIYLVGCIGLKKFPKISGNIKELYLCRTAIEEVPSSIGCLTVLRLLDMAECRKLKSISTSICKLKSLSSLNLSSCSKLEIFPEILEEMDHLTDLYLCGTAIKELPSSIEHLNGLDILDMKNCKNLESLPSSFCNLTSLGELDLSGCSKLEKLPENFGNLISLYFLFAYGCAVNQIPSSIVECENLEVADFSGCKGLVLPPFPALCSITDLRLSFCNLIEIPEDLCCLSSLKDLDLRGNDFDILPSSFKQLSQLESLRLNDCNMLRTIPELPSGLRYLEAMSCKQLQALPELPSCLEELDASILGLVSEHFDEVSQGPSYYFLIFTNSLNLNQNAYNILADSQLRIQHMAAASLRLASKNELYLPHSISFYLPGSEIPEWFSNQSSGSSLTIQLPQHWCRTFIGFALCAVIAFGENYYDCGSYVNCNYHFEANNGDRASFNSRLNFSGDNLLIDSDHILLVYDPCFGIRSLNGEYTTASFEFHSQACNPSGVLKEGCKVKFCGVSPIYAQNNITKPRIAIEEFAATDQDFGETSPSRVFESESPPSCSNGVHSSYKILRSRGGLLLFCCWIFVICLFGGLLIFRLLKLFMASPPT